MASWDEATEAIITLIHQVATTPPSAGTPLEKLRAQADAVNSLAEAYAWMRGQHGN